MFAWLEKQGEMDIEKPITIGKCKLTGKAAELAKEVTPESLDEAKKKLLAEEELVKQGKEEMLAEVCEYIKENLYQAWVNTNNRNTYRSQSTELFIKNLKKAMEDKE